MYLFKYSVSSLAFNLIDYYSFLKIIYFAIYIYTLCSCYNFYLVHQVIPILDSQTPLFASSFTLEVRRNLYSLVTLLYCSNAAFQLVHLSYESTIMFRGK